MLNANHSALLPPLCVEFERQLLGGLITLKHLATAIKTLNELRSCYDNATIAYLLDRVPDAVRVDVSVAPGSVPSPPYVVSHIPTNGPFQLIDAIVSRIRVDLASYSDSADLVSALLVDLQSALDSRSITIFNVVDCVDYIRLSTVGLPSQLLNALSVVAGSFRRADGYLPYFERPTVRPVAGPGADLRARVHTANGIVRLPVRSFTSDRIIACLHANLGHGANIVGRSVVPPHLIVRIIDDIIATGEASDRFVVDVLRIHERSLKLNQQSLFELNALIAHYHRTVDTAVDGLVCCSHMNHAPRAASRSAAAAAAVSKSVRG